MRKNVISILITVIMTIVCFTTVSADSAISIMRAYCTEDEAIVYVEGAPENAELKYQIGNVLCDDISSSRIEESGLPFRTLVMIDNSLSISQNGRDKEKELIKSMIENHAEGEQIRLATFGEEIEYLSEYSTDYRALIGVTESVSYNDQETFLTDVLFDVLDELKADYRDGYTRIIIISDGVDNKPIGVTKDELYSKIKGNPYPVYTIGTRNGKNESELENMFALSRMTNADYYVLDDVENLDEVLRSLWKDYTLSVVVAKLPESAKTGGSQNSRLTIGDRSAESVINTPFGAAITEQKESDETDEIISEDTASSEAYVDEHADDSLEERFDLKGFVSDHLTIIIILGIALMALIALIIVWAVTKSRERKSESSSKQMMQALSNSPGRSPFENAPTEIILNDGEDGTNLMFAGSNDSKLSYRLTLTDKNDPGKVFECELKDTVIVGRKSDVTDLAINYDKSVSSKHCMILSKNGHFYIQDLGSANHTKLNGKVIYAEEEVKNGDIISMGRVELYFSAI